MNPQEKAGIAVEKLVGKIYWKTFPLLDTAPESCVESIKHKEGRSDELQLPSGEIYFTRYRPIIDVDGNYCYSLHIMEDITEKLRITEEQCKLSTALQQLKESVLILDADGIICYANMAFYKLFGYIKDEIIGQHIDMLRVQEQEEYMQPPSVLRQLRKHSHWQGEVYRQAKDGSAIPVLLTASPLHNAQGMFVGYAGSYLDLRDIRAAESNRQLLRSLIDQSLDAIEVIDPNTGRILDVNLTACQTLGYAREELLSMTIYDVDPDINDEFKKSISEKLQHVGRAIFERRHQRKDGTIFPVEVSLKKAQIGEKIFAMSIVRDITERKQAEILLQQALRAQNALSVCNEILIRAKSEEVLLADMCSSIVRVANYKFAWIGYVDDNTKQSLQPVSCARYHNAPCADVGGEECTRINLCDRKLGAPVLHLGTSLIVQNIFDNPQFSAWHNYARQNEFQSYIGLPLKNDVGAIFGVLNIYSTEADAFSEKEVMLLEELANDLAFGICTLRTRDERDHFQSEHLKSIEQLKTSLISTIQAIGNTVEKRDPYTAGHQSQVAELSEAIAKEMGLDVDVIEGIKLGASIHDIGKIYVPAEILNRPGRLTAAEFEIIKSHPEVGYDIIKDVKFPWPVADMILQHHERMDGSGYPKGLKGEEIILEARILAVADVVEAITSHRPYRAAHGIDKALNEIETKQGQFYDVSVVDACLRLFRQTGYQFNRLE